MSTVSTLTPSRAKASAVCPKPGPYSEGPVASPEAAVSQEHAGGNHVVGCRDDGGGSPPDEEPRGAYRVDVAPGVLLLVDLGLVGPIHAGDQLPEPMLLLGILGPQRIEPLAEPVGRRMCASRNGFHAATGRSVCEIGARTRSISFGTEPLTGAVCGLPAIRKARPEPSRSVLRPNSCRDDVAQKLAAIAAGSVRVGTAPRLTRPLPPAGPSRLRVRRRSTPADAGARSSRRIGAEVLAGRRQRPRDAQRMSDAATTPPQRIASMPGKSNPSPKLGQTVARAWR